MSPQNTLNAITSDSSTNSSPLLAQLINLEDRVYDLKSRLAPITRLQNPTAESDMPVSVTVTDRLMDINQVLTELLESIEL